MTNLALTLAARDLVDLKAREAEAEAAYQAAVHYYQSGGWKHDGIDVDAVGVMMIQLKADKVALAQVRTAKQVEFETAITAHTSQPDEAIHVREHLLATAQRQRLYSFQEPKPDAFAAWLKRHAEMSNNPTPKTKQPSRKRMLQR
jgi:hypothetical protein